MKNGVVCYIATKIETIMKGGLEVIFEEESSFGGGSFQKGNKIRVGGLFEASCSKEMGSGEENISYQPFLSSPNTKGPGMRCQS